MVRKITPEQVEQLLDEKYPNLKTALERQNWYTFLEALEDLTGLVNEEV